MRRILRAFATVAPPAAALTVLAAGVATPGYDPLVRTVSRLAVPGAPAALATDLAIALAGLACAAVAIEVQRPARLALLAAGAGFMVAAVVHLDPGSEAATWSHRAASAVAMLGLTAAPLVLWRDYGRVLLMLGIAEVLVLALAPVLLAAAFYDWGAWERVLLVLALTSLVIVARRMPSTEEPASATAAIQRRAATYTPVPSVNRAKP